MVQINLSPEHLPVLDLIAQHGAVVRDLPRATAQAHACDPRRSAIPARSVRRLLRVGLAELAVLSDRDAQVKATAIGRELVDRACDESAAQAA